MDRDIDGGWRMGRDWMENPDREQRCRIAADKLLSVLEQENHQLGLDLLSPHSSSEPSNARRITSMVGLFCSARVLWSSRSSSASRECGSRG